MYFKNFFHKYSKISIFMKIIALGRATGFWKLFKTQNAHGGRNVLPRMFVGGCWHFLEKCWTSGGKRTRCPRQPIDAMDGVCRRPRHNEKNLFTFRRKFTPGDLTSRKDVPFAMGVRGGYGNPTLRAMRSIHKCVAKGAPHLWIDGCRRI